MFKKTALDVKNKVSLSTENVWGGNAIYAKTVGIYLKIKDVV